MIDAPDCGTTVNAFLKIGQELIDRDAAHSLLFSVHAYWGADYDGSGDLELAVRARLPMVVGEVANKQFANGDECYYGLDGTGVKHAPNNGFNYQKLLIYLTQFEVGWMAWSWGPDKCPDRRITPDGVYTGAYAELTTYGKDILHQGTYGLQSGYFDPQKVDTLPGAPPPP